MSSKVYAGGLPGDGTNLFPKADMEGEVGEAYGGEMGIKTSKGGPASSSGSKTHDFLDSKGYHAGSLEPGRPGGMKIVNPDDISHSS